MCLEEIEQSLHTLLIAPHFNNEQKLERHMVPIKKSTNMHFQILRWPTACRSELAAEFAAGLGDGFGFSGFFGSKTALSWLWALF